MCPDGAADAVGGRGIAPMDECEIALVIPVYRNEATIEPLARRAQSALQGHPEHRIVYVVDASPDASWEQVQRLARHDARIGGVLLASNQGQHRAILIGLRLARAACVVVMDADLQDPPELVPALAAECLRTGTTVFALRQGRYQSPARMVTSRAFKTVLGWCVGLPATAGTFLAMPRATVEPMCRTAIRHPQVVVMARRFGADWSGIHYHRVERVEGKSAYSPVGRLRAAARSLACAWECRAVNGGAAGFDELDPAAGALPIAARVNV